MLDVEQNSNDLAPTPYLVVVQEIIHWIAGLQFMYFGELSLYA